MMPSKSNLRLLALVAAILAAVAAPAITETTVCEVRCGYDRSSVTISGYVEDLEVSHAAYANFDIRSGQCEVHVYWNFPGSPKTWLADGAYVEIYGSYEQYNSVYRGPEITAYEVILTSPPPPSSTPATASPAEWTLVPWGAAGEVAGSCYQLTVPRSSILVDCGSFMNNDDMPSSAAGDVLDCDSFPFSPQGVDAVVITHAHDDHLGRLHYLVAAGFDGPIYMTHATAEIYTAKLDDTLYYSCLPDMREAPARNEMRNRIEGMLVEHGYYEQFDVSDGISATFVDAGHIPGSASVVLDMTNGGQTETIVFSGDLGSGFHPFLNAPDSNYFRTIDAAVLVIESTYGASEPREYPDDLYEVFYETVQNELDQHKLVVIPTFALDRTQRVLAALIAGADSGQLQLAKPIGVGGKSSYYLTEKYMEMQMHPEQYEQYFSPGFFDNATFGGFGDIWAFVRENASDSSRETPAGAWDYSVIVTPSGTGSSSYAKELIDAYGTSESVAFLQVGWTPDSSPLGELRDNGQVLSIPGISNVFSGHSDLTGLVEYASAFPSLRRIVITHGDDPLGARAGLEAAVCTRLQEVCVLCPSYGQEIPLLDLEWGCGCEETQFCLDDDCVSASYASSHVGERVWVCGLVADTRRLDSGRTFLNLGNPYPDQDFTVMIEPSQISMFDSALGLRFHENLAGQRICAYGLVSDYDGTPQIIPVQPWQIWCSEFGIEIPAECACSD